MTRLGMTVTQALLRGFGPDVNLVRLRQARLDTRLSEFELRGFTEALVADVERTCWDYALARRQIEIVEESLKVARQQLDETEELIAVGRLARAELAAVQAEVAAQEQALIEARANKETIRLQLAAAAQPGRARHLAAGGRSGPPADPAQINPGSVASMWPYRSACARF
jgi:outer membrane protein